MRRITISGIAVSGIAVSGLVALAAVLGSGAGPAAAVTRPAAVTQLAAAARAASVAAPAAGGSLTEIFPKISCVSAADCLGIEGSTGTTTVTSIARWNGSAWKRARVTLPKGTRSLDLTGVSCKGAKSCLVVGDYYMSTSSSALGHALALMYNGTSLRPTPRVPLPAAATDVTLGGVSCTTSSHCVAFGTAAGNSAAFGTTGMVTLIETWNGAKWTLHTVASPAKAAVEFSGISCVTSVYCVLAGEYFSSTGTETLYLRSWNGKKLTVMKPASLGSSKGLPIVGSVSCATLSNCGVAGIMDGSSTGTVSGFAEVWNGKTWRAATLAWPAATAESFLLGISCFGAHTCDAVGLAGSATTPSAVAEAYNGTSWALQPVPAPATGRVSILSSVSCLSAAKCVAVGETGLASAATPATMTGVWNGTSWTFDPGF